MKRYRSGIADRTHNRRRLPSQEVLNDLQELNIEGDAHMVCLGLRAEVLQQVVLHVGPGWKELALPGGDGGVASGGEDRVLHVRAGEARGGHFTDEVRVRQEVLDSGVADLVDDVDGEAPEGSLLVEFAAHVGTVGGGGGGEELTDVLVSAHLVEIPVGHETAGGMANEVDLCGTGGGADFVNEGG